MVCQMASEHCAARHCYLCYLYQSPPDRTPLESPFHMADNIARVSAPKNDSEYPAFISAEEENR